MPPRVKLLCTCLPVPTLKVSPGLVFSAPQPQFPVCHGFIEYKFVSLICRYVHFGHYVYVAVAIPHLVYISMDSFTFDESGRFIMSLANNPCINPAFHFYLKEGSQYVTEMYIMF
ncbi:Short-chain dehydrogenase/reductase SAT3 [Fusarium oxysporum f. sp. albedinis]|nr:Short-chain dehydrogenase/reductase SAT3 [Fusarium oxysporum f. sp. albedinis]